MTILNNESKFNLSMPYREEVLTQISGKIQEKFGLSKPKICEISNYERNKTNIESEIKRKKHFSENDWPECRNVFNRSLRSINNDKFDDSENEEESNFNDEQRSGTRFSR